MGIESNRLVILFYVNGQPMVMKCDCSKYLGQLSLLAEASDGHRVPVSVAAVKHNNLNCLLAKSTDNQDCAVRRSIASFIGMCWIDEADPVYTKSSDTYLQDLNDFKEASKTFLKWTAACQNPGTTPNDNVYGGILPIQRGVPIHMEGIPRSPSLLNLKSTFDYLMESFRNKEPRNIQVPDYLILTIDDSGSMSPATISPAYGQLIDYIRTIYPSIKIIEKRFSHEAWLRIWLDQITSII